LVLADIGVYILPAHWPTWPGDLIGQVYGGFISKANQLTQSLDMLGNIVLVS